MHITKHISNLVKEQFPDFYREEGPVFIDFIKTYYEWLEESGNTIDQTRSLFEVGDIDDTADEYIKYFVNKYMVGIPVSILGDKRFLEKHILDLYRSKGSIEGMRLLFRLLYNEEIDVYIPSYDILKPSDGKYVIETYLEITEADSNNLYDQQFITGSTSKATALVEQYRVQTQAGKNIHLLYLSNVSGTFQKGESLTCSAVTPETATYVVGSITNIGVTEGGDGTIVHQIGQRFKAINGSGAGLQILVTETQNLAGIISFQLVDGGTGYSANAVVTVGQGSNTAGFGANLVVTGISNTSTYRFNGTTISPFTSVLIGANAYGIAPLATANLSSTIATLGFSNVTVGTISSIQTTSPGLQYNGNVVVTVTDPYTSGARTPDGRGGIVGLNAIITGDAAFGDGVVKSVKVADSGVGYYVPNELVTFENVNDPADRIKGNVIATGRGFAEGRWKNTDSFLSSNKYIQDSYFYQEFSYQIKSSRSLDKYVSILRQLVHPAGNEPFGQVVVNSVEQGDKTITSTVTQR